MDNTSFQKKNYVQGIVRSVDSKNGRKIINISINVQQLQELSNDQGYAQIALYELPEPDQYGNTHFIVSK